ncbi:MAG: hypothetical protein IJU71_03410 [Selenomonadaceae bacterium]|nr:hypothetical protein [Selenomonadaceae bacterium]
MRKFVLTALALMLTLSAASTSEAARANDDQSGYCCRGSYCYNQNYNRHHDQNDQYCDDYCYDGQRGCRW